MQAFFRVTLQNGYTTVVNGRGESDKAMRNDAREQVVAHWRDVTGAPSSRTMMAEVEAITEGALRIGGKGWRLMQRAHNQALAGRAGLRAKL